MSISISARRTVIALAGTGLVASLAFTSSATATTQTKYYAIGPATTQISAIIPQVVTVELTNSPNSNQSFGSAELTFPGATVTAATVTTTSNGSTGWTGGPVSAGSSVAKITTSGAPPVAPGSSINVNVTVTVPITEASFHITPIVVKQSNDFSGNPGNNFVQQPASAPLVKVTAPVVTLSFTSAGEPPSVLQQSVPPSNFSYMCPVVQATAEGYPVPGITVDMGYNGANPGLVGQLSATTSTPSGTATFCSPGIGAETQGTGFVLEASSTGYAPTPADSSAFAVYPVVCTSSPCPIQATSKDTTAGGSANGSGTFGLSESFGTGITLTCDSAVTVSSFPADPFQVTASSNGVTANIFLTFSKAVVNSVPDNGAPHMPVCAGATSMFPGATDYGLNPSPAVAGDPPYQFQGLLGDCSSDPGYGKAFSSVGLDMCVVTRQKNPGATETVQVYTNSLSDPMFW